MDVTFWSRFGALLVLWLAVACQRTEPTGTFIGRGVVKDILPKERQVIIAHEDIPGFMEAMTMGFEVKEESLLAGRARGEAVTFTVEKTKDSLYLTTLARVGEPAEALSPTGAGGGRADRGGTLSRAGRSSRLHPYGPGWTPGTALQPARQSGAAGLHLHQLSGAVSSFV